MTPAGKKVPTTEEGLVSTIIPVHNRPVFLRQAVQSVLDQTYRRIEIIIVDDGSTDGTGDVAEALARQAPSVRVLHIENAGPGTARETGRREARGEYIQYLDSDDLLLPRKFETQVEALRHSPGFDIAYGYTRLVDGGGAVLAAPYKWTGRPIESLFPSLFVDRWWNTHTPLYRRTLTDAVGPWSDMRSCEDWEYEARVGALGARLLHVPGFASDTRQHGGDRVAGKPISASRARDLVRLLLALEEGASRAGVEKECAEQRHFARWAFLLARQMGAIGCREEAEVALAVARRAAVPTSRRSMGPSVYGRIASLVGWRTLGKLCEWRDRLPWRHPGPETLQKSS